jgi:hypothetical protein
MERFTVSLGINRHRRYAELFTGTYDAKGDLPAVSNEDLGEHRKVSSG